MKKINLKSAQLKEMLSKDEMKKIVGGAWCPVIKWICGDNGFQYDTAAACDVACIQACHQATVAYVQCR
jgi:hypothetical protein